MNPEEPPAPDAPCRRQASFDSKDTSLVNSFFNNSEFEFEHEAASSMLNANSEFYRKQNKMSLMIFNTEPLSDHQMITGVLFCKIPEVLPAGSFYLKIKALQRKSIKKVSNESNLEGILNFIRNNNQIPKDNRNNQSAKFAQRPLSEKSQRNSSTASDHAQPPGREPLGSYKQEVHLGSDRGINHQSAPAFINQSQNINLNINININNQKEAGGIIKQAMEGLKNIVRVKPRKKSIKTSQIMPLEQYKCSERWGLIPEQNLIKTFN
jgi:hypothetical protein